MKKTEQKEESSKSREAEQLEANRLENEIAALENAGDEGENGKANKSGGANQGAMKPVQGMLSAMAKGQAGAPGVGAQAFASPGGAMASAGGATAAAMMPLKLAS